MQKDVKKITSFYLNRLTNLHLENIIKITY